MGVKSEGAPNGLEVGLMNPDLEVGLILLFFELPVFGSGWIEWARVRFRIRLQVDAVLHRRDLTKKAVPH